MGHDDPIEGEGLENEPEDEEGDGSRPLTSEERDSVRADIEDLDAMRHAFEPQGAKGVVISCSECGANHFYGWELLRDSLEHMLQTGEPRMHEPAFEPREDDYVVWDYGKGYVDALADAGLDGDEAPDIRACAWCHSPVDPRSSFCPQCGRPLAVIRLFRQLLDRGLEEREAKALLVRAGFEPFS
jgi:RNase P subunit RPR2